MDSLTVFFVVAGALVAVLANISVWAPRKVWVKATALLTTALFLPAAELTRIVVVPVGDADEIQRERHALVPLPARNRHESQGFIIVLASLDTHIVPPAGRHRFNFRISFRIDLNLAPTGPGQLQAETCQN